MTRKHLITLGTAIAITATSWSTAHADNSAQIVTKDPAAAALKSKGARIGYHRATGRVNFIGFDKGKAVLALGAAPGLQAQNNAMAVLQQYAPLFGIEAPGNELRLKKQFATESGRSVVRYQQVYKGLPVIGGEMIVNIDDRGRMLSLNGEVSAKLTLTSTAERSPSQAVETALEFVAKHHQLAATSLSASEPVLSVYDPRLLGPNTHPTLLVWQIEVTANSLAPIREYVLVDAIRGNIVLQFNQVHQLKRRNTYDAGGTDILPGTLVCNESNGDACTSGANVEADFAHRYAGDTYDFYMTNHARDSLNDAGMTLVSSVNYNNGACPNAYWSGSQMVYCLGAPQGDDVVSHELTHGVTEHTSNLFYYYQSGAINESLSDVWGEFVDLTNGSGSDSAAVRWQIGEDSVFGAIRDMEDPTVFGDPDRMTSASYNVTASDNGGVHTNSGINNKAVFLMVDGGTFNTRTINAMGITKVAKIYYEAQTTLLTSASDYLDLYNALNQACQNLVGTSGIASGDCTNVRNATEAVEMHLEPSPGYNPEAVVCPTGYSPVNSFYDDIESGLGNWSFSHDTALTAINWFDWYAAVPAYPYASSGVHSLIGFNVNSTSDQYARISVTVPNVSGHMPYLHFNHAYNFHAGSYDGGVLEYSTNGGSTWTDAIGLLESGRDYNGTVRNTFSNPLGGKSAYVDDSHGYVSTRLDLTMLAGQSVDFRWRVGTDSVADLYAYGWWLDDVRVYHCNSAPVAIAQGLATDEDTGLAITLAGSDVDGDSISYSISAAPANGTLSGAAPNLTYTPNPNYFGSDSFSYTVDDGAGGTDTAVISITVNSVNDAPGAATLVTPADSATDVDPASVAFKWQPATDVDGDTVSYELKVCEDAGFNTGCNSVNIASLQVNILIAGIGGGSLLLLGVAGMSMRRKQLVWAIPLYITIALLAACSSGSSSDPVFIDTSINATVDGLTPGIDYYWKVITSDGNTGVTDSSVRMFTTAP